MDGIPSGFHGDLPVAPIGGDSQTHAVGILGDLPAACHLLESHGVLITGLNDDGTEQTNLLHTMLAKPECLKIFGEDWVFELRGCLIEKTGWNFRNRLAHGLVTQEECFSAVGITLWWLVLRLMVSALHGRPSGDADSPTEPA